MSGWDTPSRPTWDPQDGPEDGTQAFPAPDDSGADDPWSQPAGSGWGGSADSQDFGRSEFGAADFGASDFGSANDHRAPSSSPEPGSFSPEPGNGFAPESNGFPPERDGFFPQEFEQRQPGATLPGRGRPGSGPQVSARDEPPWPGPGRQESRQESARPDYGRTGEYGRQDPGRADFDRPGAGGQDFPRREPGRTDFSTYSTYAGQPDQAEQAPAAANRGDSELAARMDPALQDFFAPTKPDPRYSSGRPSQSAQAPGLPGPAAASPGLPGSGLPGSGLPGSGRPGPSWADQDEQPPPRRDDGRGPQRPNRQPTPWEDQADYPSTGPRTGGRDARDGRDGRDGRNGQDRPVPRGNRSDESELLPASKGKRILAIAAVVVVVVAGGVYLAVHKTTGNNNVAADTTPSPTASAPASTPTAKPKASTTKSAVTGNGTSSGGYVLSTPDTAGGYPIGSDPHFLSIATSTAATIEGSAVKGGGGKVAGSPVSASYTLPDAQTIEFVGYQGTFDPTTVMANLKAFGSAETSYSPGPNGGKLECANTPGTASDPSGAVCVWVTKTTLGFTEFFTQADGPEPLNTAMDKGAADTVGLRASVEKLKS
ncbi:MAG TPA: hypothetical protein VHZ33_19610 [Trebonia sp.]|jgi:hypothetical protein|nr:hypothetical protein [Trebonia sp.]